MSRSNHGRTRGHNWPKWLRNVGWRKARAMERLLVLRDDVADRLPRRLRDVLHGWWS